VLTVVERPATGPTERLLVLVPGYGDEPARVVRHLDVVDPDGRWHVAVVRPRLETPDGPAWFTVGEHGPDAEQLATGVADLTSTAAALLDRHGLTSSSLTVAGFSQGGALALAATLDPGAVVRPASVAALAAYLPHRERDQEPALAEGRHVLIAHWADDEVVDALLGRSAAKALERAGALVTWNEVDGGHHLAPHLVDVLRAWLDERAAPVG
jgi:phospholipase/carboxylesterase